MFILRREILVPIVTTITILATVVTGEIQTSIFGIEYINELPVHRVEKYLITNETNITVGVYTDETGGTSPGFAIETNGDLSLFYLGIYVECTADYPVTWVYEGNGYAPAELYNTRNTVGAKSNNNSAPTYSYTTTMAFQEFMPFVNQSSGKYTCVNRLESKRYLHTENPTYTIRVFNGSVPERPGVKPFSRTKCNQTTTQTDLVHLSFNQTEMKYYCCSKNHNVSKLVMLITACETPESCALKRNCAEEFNSCVSAYDEPSFNADFNMTCVQSDVISHQAGEADCIVDDQCEKFMSYTGARSTRESVVFPLEFRNVTMASSTALRISLDVAGDKPIIFCEGPNFYVEFGAIWTLQFENGTITSVAGTDGVFGPPTEVYSTLLIDPLDYQTLVQSVCSVPLLNHPSDWINATIRIPNRKSDVPTPI